MKHKFGFSFYGEKHKEIFLQCRVHTDPKNLISECGEKTSQTYIAVKKYLPLSFLVFYLIDLSHIDT